MAKKWALLFALLGVSAMISISVAISYGSVTWALLFTGLFVLIMIVGFAFKARSRRRDKTND